MTTEQEQNIRDLLKVPASASVQQVDLLLATVKTFLHTAASAKRTKLLTQASLTKLYSVAENTSTAEPPSDADKTSSSPPPKQTQLPPQPQQTQTSAPVSDQPPTQQVPPLPPASLSLQGLSTALSFAIAGSLLFIIVFGYNKFVTRPQIKREQIAVQQEEKRQQYKREAEITAQQETEKRAECDREQASLAGMVANKELARQQRYQAYKDADPNGLPLVPTFPEVRRELKDIQEKIDLLESINPNAIDSAMEDLQNQINKDQTEADKLNAKVDGELSRPGPSRYKSNIDGYDNYRLLMLKIDANQRKINELYALKQDPQGNLDKLKAKRSQLQLELGPNQ